MSFVIVVEDHTLPDRQLDLPDNGSRIETVPAAEPTPPSLTKLRPTLVALVLAAAAGCTGPSENARQAAPAPPQPIHAEWNNPSWSASVKGGWRVSNCNSGAHSLCVAEDGDSIGIVRLKDLPSLGEEKTTSAHQVQAVLAGRINSLYQFKIGRWAHACGKSYRVSTSRPGRVAMGEGSAMKYELTGTVEAEVAERLVGYWSFRDGIETVIEARAATEKGCQAEPLGQIPAPDGAGQVFSPESLARFEPILDRIVAGSRLPPPAQFTPSAGSNG